MDAIERKGMSQSVLRGIRSFRRMCRSHFKSVGSALRSLGPAERVLTREEFVRIVGKWPRGGVGAKHIGRLWKVVDPKKLGLLWVADLRWMCLDATHPRHDAVQGLTEGVTYT